PGHTQLAKRRCAAPPPHPVCETRALNLHLQCYNWRMALFWGPSAFPQAYADSLFHAPTWKAIRQREHTSLPFHALMWKALRWREQQQSPLGTEQSSFNSGVSIHLFLFAFSTIAEKKNEWKHQKFEKGPKYRKKVFTLGGGGKVSVSILGKWDFWQWKQI
ncbi:hypothetical protein P7M41_25900, partial [Vibrio parahaemolyticus]|nr:hypothetical protein [Vibrio parahaemolyticus]